VRGRSLRSEINQVDDVTVDSKDEGTIAAAYTIVRRDGGAETVDAEVINEKLVSIFVNGQELATIMCTPLDQGALALGFLANEGVIDSAADVRAVHVCPSGSCVVLWVV
jgi:formate dehydrogenase assembly factor FdhD